MSDPTIALFDNTPIEFDPWKKNHVAEKKVRRENFWERLSDAYISLLAAGIVFAYTAGLSHAFSASLKENIGGGLVREGFGVLSGEAAASAVVMVGMLAVLSLVCRLGPVAVDSAQGFWWLTLPVRRSPFLARLLRQRLVTTALYGAFLWLPIGYGTTLGGISSGGLVGVLLGSASLALLFVLISLLAALAQTRGWSKGFSTTVNYAMLGVVLAYTLDVFLLLTQTGTLARFWALLPSMLPAAAQNGNWWIPLILALIAVSAFQILRNHLELIDSKELVSRGAASAHAGAALALLDDKSLATAIEQAGTNDSRRAQRKREHIRKRGGDVFSRLIPFHWVRGPYSALVRAELLVLLRAPRVWRGLVTGFGIPLAGVFAAQGGHPLVLGALIIIGCCVAARAAATAAAQAADVPSVEAIIPLGRSAMRQVHTLIAAALTIPWGISLAATLGWAVETTAAEMPLLLSLGALTGLGLAAGGVRLAYRPELDWGSVLLLTALGQATGPLIQHFTHGYDVMVVASVALLAGLLLNPIPPPLVAVAGIVAVVLWAVSTSTSANSKAHGIR
ncbi:hypothetical protein CQ018_18575 [Arthrobacter sp. MYb227]|uniref:DUF6297 family protein n=1 Tax=Arthrobacter sp. MYb227 TaxID=1848601 RepID=UPI000CFCB405|nr:DUF6297 family protein [Arthrobacter sp. MYb227]PQZ86686.1 hypothetical protein CQ018_18575 [Arthrobacter sp. MYb227]